MEFLFELITAATTSAATATYITHKLKADKKEKRPNVKISTEVKHRLTLLENQVKNPTMVTISNHDLQVKVSNEGNVVIYDFHYLKRLSPFVTIFYMKQTQEAVIHFALKELQQGGVWADNILENLRLAVENDQKREVPEHSSKQKESEKKPEFSISIVKDEKESEKEKEVFENTDPVYIKANEILRFAAELIRQLPTNDIEKIHFLEDRVHKNITKVIDVYRPLKPETKKRSLEKVLNALDVIENEIKKIETNLEDKKIKDLENVLGNVEIIYQEKDKKNTSF